MAIIMMMCMATSGRTEYSCQPLQTWTLNRLHMAHAQKGLPGDVHWTPYFRLSSCVS